MFWYGLLRPVYGQPNFQARRNPRSFYYFAWQSIVRAEDLIEVEKRNEARDQALASTRTGLRFTQYKQEVEEDYAV